MKPSPRPSMSSSTNGIMRFEDERRELIVGEEGGTGQTGESRANDDSVGCGGEWIGGFGAAK